MRDIECIGGNVITSSSEKACVSLEFLKRVKHRDLLADNILCPSLHDADIDEVKDMIGYEKSELQYDPQVLVTEWIHEAAFGAKTPLGRPTMTPDQLPKLNASHYETLREYFVGSKMVIAMQESIMMNLYFVHHKVGSIPMSTEVSKRKVRGVRRDAKFLSFHTFMFQLLQVYNFFTLSKTFVMIAFSWCITR